LDEATTRALLAEVPEVYRTQVNDVLLSALARVLGGWTDRDRVVVDLEGHGREEVFADLDLSRTVGWFTSMFPVALSAGGDWGGLIKTVKEELRSVPRRGIGFGALRHLGGGVPDVAEPEVSFNYLGRFDSGDGPFTMRGELDSAVADDERRPHVLDVVGRVEQRCLTLTWVYSEGLHRRETVESLAEGMASALREIVAHCALPGVGGRTPSDFPLARLDQATVDRLVGDGRAVEDVYPLTPMQAGMVFHGLSQSEQGVYFEQVAFVLDGVPDARELGAAWQHVVDRTPVLRTHVAWEGLAEPVQVVRRDAVLPVSYPDWARADHAVELRRALDEDRADRLDLGRAPLLRVTIARLSDTSVQVIWTFHHVLLDGWSVFQVLSDVVTAYGALRRGESPTLPARRPFADYVRWLAGRDDGQAEQHWRGLLADLTEPTPLPYDRPPTGDHEIRSSDWHTVELADTASARLYEFAKRHRLTVNALVQGAWALVLSAYGGDDTVCFGATVSGRPADLVGVDDITGIFINTLPVRITVPGGEPVVDWLRRVQAAQAESRRFEHLPLTRLRAWSGVDGGVNLFDSIVVFENYPVSRDDVAQHGVELRDLQAMEMTNYALSVVVAPGTRMSLGLGYDPALFDEATVARLTDQLAHVLDALTAEPNRSVDSIDVLSEQDLHTLLVEFNDTARDVPFTTLPDLVRAQVARTPDAAAVVSDQGTVTFAELDARSDRLAALVAAKGAGPERIVALALPRSTEIVVAQLAVLKSGAAYLPVDPEYPAERIAFMLTDARPTMVLTTSGLAEDLPRVDGMEIVRVDTPDDTVDRPCPDVTIAPDHPAYVIYTSGSTGRPKGVVVTHAGLASFSAAEVDRFDVWPGDRVLQFSSPSFDASVLELCMSLPAGAALVVPPPGPLLGAQLGEVLAGNGVTHALIPPVAMATVPDVSLPEFRTLVVGGDACTADLVRRWAPGRDMVNAYGPTESTVVATWSAALVPGVVPPIGGPIWNTSVYVLDAALRVVPMGAEGELYIAGPSLARGYLDRPGLTADRFVANPFGRPGSRMYRTGDLVRWTARGELEFLGRADNQVKIRGFRVEPGEIETVLRGNSDIGEAVVVAREDESGIKRLVAYLVPTAGRDLDLDAVRSRLVRRLPDYLVPSIFVVLESLPLTPNGKLDRRALPAPVVTESAGPAFVPPATETEQVLADIWAEVLGVRRVGARDNFFDLGGDSVRSLGVASSARAAFGVDLTPRDVMTARTVTALADLIEEKILAELEVLASAGAHDLGRDGTS
jgi:amino acid adenylation domain-containing protein/non-ribosomal peptide synthase protein (TIGR01720 family)